MQKTDMGQVVPAGIKKRSPDGEKEAGLWIPLKENNNSAIVFPVLRDGGSLSLLHILF